VILVTGASGFVGRALVSRLVGHQQVRISVRAPSLAENSPETEVVRAQLSTDQDWSHALVGVSVVVHCAARVHVMNEESSDPLAEFRRVNVDGTLRLASQAAVAGVKRFVFLSSIKVNGEQTEFGKPFAAGQQPNPGDPYGVSKMEAEDGLRALARETGMEVVIIRPPLVYGPGVKANFLTMMRWLRRGLPLPLGAVTGNRRSLVALDNLVDLIVICIDHPSAANQIFLVSDGESLSTDALLRRMGVALGRPARLIPVPVFLLQLGATLLGKRALAQRLCGSLEIDISKTRELLGWTPPFSADEGFRRTAAYWIKSQQEWRE
jgi:nucleoside-diphosphate-sugar epimerase